MNIISYIALVGGGIAVMAILGVALSMASKEFLSFGAVDFLEVPADVFLFLEERYSGFTAAYTAIFFLLAAISQIEIIEALSGTESFAFGSMVAVELATAIGLLIFAVRLKLQQCRIA
jgi:hypothetical protein